MMGKRIGFKALENRLNQMWAKQGSLSIVDLGNDYFTVSFANNDDHCRALLEGPWMIYDHYLSVWEWKPNFCPSSDAIEQIAVWVRISGLPLEYFDARVLAFIGNRIGSTVKVDRNTLKIERGKYARLCVQVDLTQPLLAMFSIKGRHYKIEYEGLHLLCLRYGRFGHDKEECSVAAFLQGEMVNAINSGAREESNMPNMVKEDGPWMVVPKTRRNRRSKHFDGRDSGRITTEAPTGIPQVELNGVKGGESSTGSRFNVLDVKILTLERIDAINAELEIVEETKINEGEESDIAAGNSKEKKLKGPRNKIREEKRKAKRVVTQATRGIRKEGKKIGIFGKTKGVYEKLIEKEGFEDVVAGLTLEDNPRAVSFLQSNGPSIGPFQAFKDSGSAHTLNNKSSEENLGIFPSDHVSLSPKKPPDYTNNEGDGRDNDSTEADDCFEKENFNMDIVEETQTPEVSGEG